MFADGLQRADQSASAAMIIARASFVTNIFRESNMMSSFQLVRGYAPLILGVPHQEVAQELLTAHIQREVTRALERIMHSNVTKVIDASKLEPGTSFLVYYKSSKRTMRQTNGTKPL